MTYTQFEVQNTQGKWASSMKRVGAKVLELRCLAFDIGQKELCEKLMGLERYIDSEIKENEHD